MWEINEDTTVDITELMGSKIYTVDNVFKEPKRLERWLFSRLSFPVGGSPWSQNQIHYNKARYIDFVDESAPLVVVAQHLCKQKLGNNGGFSTNVENWIPSDYNTYGSHYWWPHLDKGYTCIVYFHESNGTNLYHPKLKEEEWFKTLMKAPPSGKQPWIPKEKVELLTELKAEYNRMVLFDGDMFPHGAAVNDETYFGENIFIAPLSKRNNLCFFYEK